MKITEPSRLRLFLRNLLHGIFFDVRGVCGMRLTVFDAQDDDEAPNKELEDKVVEAIELIFTCDFPRLNRAASDLLGDTLVCDAPRHYAQFNPSTFTCELTAEYVRSDVSVEELAMTIVYEATHARLWKAGIGYEEEIRMRVEAVCLRREIAFARKLPDDEYYVEYAKQRLADLNNGYYTDEAFEFRRRHHRFRLIRNLRNLGVSTGFIRFLGCIRKAIGAVRRCYVVLRFAFRKISSSS